MQKAPEFDGHRAQVLSVDETTGRRRVFPAPVPPVSNIEIEDLLNLLNGQLRSVFQCIGKQQIREQALKALGKLHIAEQRLIRVAHTLNEVASELDTLPVDSPERAALQGFASKMIQAINGER